jgi:hypothetical protein
MAFHSAARPVANVPETTRRGRGARLAITGHNAELTAEDLRLTFRSRLCRGGMLLGMSEPSVDALDAGYGLGWLVPRLRRSHGSWVSGDRAIILCHDGFS